MAVSASLEIDGIEHAINNLRTLERKAVRRVVNAGIRAGMKEVVKEVRMQTPTKTGALRRSWRGSVKLDRSTGTVIGTVRSKPTKAMLKKGQNPYYAHMVIGGTKPHDIHHVTFGGRSYTTVHHPGIRPNPFVERAAHHVFRRAIHSFSKSFSAKMDSEVESLSK